MLNDAKNINPIKVGMNIFREVKGKNFNSENFDAAFILASEKDKKINLDYLELNADKN